MSEATPPGPSAAVAPDGLVPRLLAEIEADLGKWLAVAAEARARFEAQRQRAPKVGAVEVAEAHRLRNDWRYAEQVHARQRRRRSRRAADEHRARFERYLARFGATTLEDLAVIGSGFGDTEADIAIREAATVVALAEQRCTDLRAELDAVTVPAGTLHPSPALVSRGRTPTGADRER